MAPLAGAASRLNGCDMFRHHGLQRLTTGPSGKRQLGLGTSAGRFSSEEEGQEDEVHPGGSTKRSKDLPAFPEDIYVENSDEEFALIRADQAKSKAKRHAFADDSLAEEQIAAPLRKSKEKGSKIKASINFVRQAMTWPSWISHQSQVVWFVLSCPPSRQRRKRMLFTASV